ncbi:MAG: hypothetical protein QOF66_4253 [Mycobacterium sp.]|jgi:hypothetical protein|nr:hypothetical protein [Mycobacterium sp.]
MVIKRKAFGSVLAAGVTPSGRTGLSGERTLPAAPTAASHPAVAAMLAHPIELEIAR